ncbi:hypothetical protein HYU07_03645 [Candidatus Woesearchaeota archaeon]|nr:hypothetical protein [Candidatus Woesearchaeota archaeon]
MSYLIKNLKVIAAGGLCLMTALLSNVRADDIFKGLRGPTNWQLDERIAYSRNEKNVETVTNNLILKYWDGDEFGKFGFISLPYKFIDSTNLSENGLSDISIGAGPRGRTFPTGNKGLGNERYDLKTSILATYLTADKKYGLDGILEYAFTGENKKDINPPNETYLGLLAGRKITDKIRFATGPTSTVKDNGDYIANWRAVIRYTVSPKLHFELVGDKGIDGHNIPESTGIGLYVRRNKKF